MWEVSFHWKTFFHFFFLKLQPNKRLVLHFPGIATSLLHFPSTKRVLYVRWYTHNIHIISPFDFPHPNAWFVFSLKTLNQCQSVSVLVKINFKPELGYICHLLVSEMSRIIFSRLRLDFTSIMIIWKYAKVNSKTI